MTLPRGIPQRAHALPGLRRGQEPPQFRWAGCACCWTMLLRYSAMALPNALSPGKGGSCFQLSAEWPRPRSENASTSASSIHWHGGIGLACGGQLLAITSLEFVAELIGELRPCSVADVDDDPGRAAYMGVAARRQAARMCVRRPATASAGGRREGGTPSRHTCRMRCMTWSAERGSMCPQSPASSMGAERSVGACSIGGESSAMTATCPRIGLTGLMPRALRDAPAIPMRNVRRFIYAPPYFHKVVREDGDLLLLGAISAPSTF